MDINFDDAQEIDYSQIVGKSSKSSDSDQNNQAEYQQYQQQTTILIKGGINSKKQTKFKMPSKFYKAKKQIDAILNDYITSFRNEYSKRNTDTKKQISINQKYLSQIKSNLAKFMSLDPPCKIQISTVQKQGSIYIYCPQLKNLISCNEEASIKKVQLSSKDNYPEMGTPIFYKQYVYILDGGTYDSAKKVFLPSAYPFRIGVKNGNLEKLQPPQKQRIKGAVFRHQNYIYLLGGFVTSKKLKTNSCQRFNLDTQFWQQLPHLNNRYGISSGFGFNNKIYVMGSRSIEVLRQGQWQNISLPYNYRYHSFCFIQQINSKDVLIMGGWSGYQRLDQMMVYNPQQNIIKNVGNRLPCTISNQKSSGVTIKNGKLFLLSPICYNIDSQFGYKNGAYELISISQIAILKNIVLI